MLKSKEEKQEEKQDGVGVIIGRFQVSTLTEGHRSLFDSVISRHKKTICIIGLSPIKCTKMNPLDFNSRCEMLKRLYPNIVILYLKDVPLNEDWSSKLDELVHDNTPPGSKTVLYGSRDGFIRSYTTKKYTTVVLEQNSYTSGTASRKESAYNSKNSKDWRDGVIWATQNQYDTAFSTVDVAICDDDNEVPRILLARKPNENKFRFVGGFVDPTIKLLNETDDLILENAKRELHEETGGNLEVGDAESIGVAFIDDWRYAAEKSKIYTHLVTTKYLFGRPVPSDDLYGGELKWFNLKDCKADNFMEDNMVPQHHKLMKMLLAFKNNIQVKKWLKV